MTAFELRMLPLDQLTPADYNPRKMTAKAVAKLRKSLETFGLVEPLVWNESTGRVVGGHQRLAILKTMNVAEVPVSVVSLGDAQEKALNVMLNNLEAQGRYDSGKLAELLHELEEMPELDMSGFDKHAVRNLDFKAELEELNPEDLNRVEVTLTMDAAVYEAIEEPLDALIRENDLVSHVRHPRDASSARRSKPTRAAALSLP